MHEEKWKLLKYKDIERNRYLISNYGKIINIKSNKFLKGNNIENEKGYVRVNLKTKNNKFKKYPIHRLVIYTFKLINYTNKNEINHKDGNKINNYIKNLEWCTREFNANHAKMNNLYKSCESSHKSIFTNDEVNQICSLFQNGKSIRYIINLLELDNIPHIIQYLNRIKNRETWINVSKKYSWDNDDIIYKTYKLSDIKIMCYMIKSNNPINKILIHFEDKYDIKKLRNILKKIKQLKLYKKIYNNIDISSTTIETYKG